MAEQALKGQIDDLFDYVQERCLWQFFSRTWDRTENIDGVIGQAERMLLGQAPLRDTPMQRLHAVDAMSMVDDFRKRFAWIAQSSPEEIKAVLQGLREKLTDHTITRSKNHELSHSLY